MRVILRTSSSLTGIGNLRHHGRSWWCRDCPDSDRSFKNAPSDFQEAEETVTNLDLLFASIKSEVDKPDSVFTRDPASGERFEALTRSCISSLNRLDDLLAKHQSLGSDHIKVLDRLRFSKKDVVEIQRELQFRHATLAAFLETLGLGGVGRIENKVDGLAQQQDKIIEAIDKIALQASTRLETASVFSNHSSDDKAVWRQLRRDLNGAGFKSSDLERHKPLIHQKLMELQTSGMIEWHAPDGDDDNKSEMSVTWIGRTKNNYRPPTAETVYEDSDEEDNYTHRQFRDSMDPLFEEEEEDILHRPGVQSEKNRTSNGRPPPYQASTTGPTLQIPIPVPHRASRSAGNSPQSSPNAFAPVHPGFGGSSPRQRRPGFQPLSRYGSSPRAATQAMPRAARQQSDRPGSSGSGRGDEGLRVGRRSAPNMIWRYRRPADIQRPPMQSADLGDGTLPKAASEGKTSDAQRLLMQGYNIESTGSRAVTENTAFENTTALFRAARNGHFETAHMLLRHGANPNVYKADGKGLLRLLVSDGNTEMVRLLLEYGAHHEKQGALPQAALFGYLSIVQLLLNYGIDINEVEKQTALFRASSNGYSDIVDLLLREGADTGFVAPSGASALYKAVVKDHYKCVRALLLYGARPEVGCGQDGETALSTACAIGHEPTVRLLLQRGARPNDLWFRRYQSAVQRRDGLVEEWFADGSLFAAARVGRVNITRLLIDYGADVHARTHFGQTAIDLAFQNGYLPLVDMLHAAGARLSPETIEAAEKRDAWERRREDQRYKDDPRRPRHYSTNGVDLERGEGRAGDSQDQRLQMSEFKRRSKSSTTVRQSTRAKGSSAGGGLKVATAATTGMLLLDSLMLLGG
ncbi:uncharacterized protein LTR77_008499 [Saxophila tyrrhenica]|uniref:Ankyrin n=1 Tax=Saxophila tyrrhenica TaxID=1690608 RepID=A0AAV9P1N8_9PEZI|nr:hypothetical protein LTR77_008499 [Saxophila tyrrhenica]